LYIYLSKILPFFVMPLGVFFMLALLALLFIRKKRRRYAAVTLIAAVSVMWVSSTPIAAKWLYGRIESIHPPVPLVGVPESDCIILLGGVVQPPEPPRVDMEFNNSIDRVHKAAELFAAGKAPYLIVTGGNQPWSRSSRSEAELIRELLVDWGVPEEAIRLEASSRNTRENAMYTRNVVDSIHCEEALLVTSAAHMPRSLAAFSAAGISVIPVSTDVRVAHTNKLTLMDFLPSAHALEMSSRAIRELVGQWVYEMKGWN
jgi:uncharacterized SAM-binding protein YcdF (DUF218 family)